MSDLTIRLLAASDRAAWEPLWKGYQTFYKVDLPAATTDVTFARLIDPTEPMDGLVAERDGRLVGIVHMIFHRSTWTPGDYCYLQDLFVSGDVRGGGVGRALIAAVVDRAKGAWRLARALADASDEHTGDGALRSGRRPIRFRAVPDRLLGARLVAEAGAGGTVGRIAGRARSPSRADCLEQANSPAHRTAAQEHESRAHQKDDGGNRKPRGCGCWKHGGDHERKRCGQTAREVSGNGAAGEHGGLRSLVQA